LFFLTSFVAVGFPSTLPGQDETPIRETGEAQWIWVAEADPSAVPAGTAFFRKSFVLGDPSEGRVEIAADDAYELYVNGRFVGSGQNWQILDSYDVTRLLGKGKNTIAVKTANRERGPGGLVARVSIQEYGHTVISYSTDASWKATAQEFRHWQMAGFNDARWASAFNFGELGVAEPWIDRVRAPDGSNPARFKTLAGFRVERVLQPRVTGSLIAMAFNELGEIVASREQGPVIVIRDKNRDGIPETSATWCEQVTSCQGLLPLNGMIFTTGQGPEGAGLYRLADLDRDGQAEDVKLLFKFTGEMSEHGPHAVVLGPDGMIYVLAGNHTALDGEYAPSSPHRGYYEGDLVQPRYEDETAQIAASVVPNGTVIRTDTEGSFAELIAGGLRNPYDLAFNTAGDLFTFDSDMEWDEGLPWYRQTRLYQVIPGAEMGWRTGWAKWPDYYLDGVPPIGEVGRGSPTGLEFYHHTRYPRQYHGTLFAGDWARGRIIALRLKPDGAGYTAESEVFVEGRPLNVTDLVVGPDGWLYFCTGGRGTEGGVYRIVWTGKSPAVPKASGVAEAVRQPQFYSAFGRNGVATLKEKLGEQWRRELGGIADNVQNEPSDRVRALELMQLVGPFPGKKFLVRLSKDESAEVRAAAVWLMGIHSGPETRAALIEKLGDDEPRVRRMACEAFLRSASQPPVEDLLPLLDDDDRLVRYAACRLLSRIPRQEWQPLVLGSQNPRTFLAGAAVLVSLAPDRESIDGVLERVGTMLNGFISDDDFIDMLRVVQLSIIHGTLAPADLGDLSSRLADEYPTSNAVMNRELVKLLAFLGETSAVDRMMAELSGTAELPERLHLVLHLRFMMAGLNSDQRMELVGALEAARESEGGESIGQYVDAVLVDFVAEMNPDERRTVLERGSEWPDAALAGLLVLPEEIDAEIFELLTALDRDLGEGDTESKARLKTGIVAVMGRSRSEEGLAWLRQAFEEQPERRAELAMGLSQVPGGENWPLLIRSLPILDSLAAEEVLARLAEAEEKPDSSEPIRQVLLTGLRLGAPADKLAADLLAKWTEASPPAPEDQPDSILGGWQQWYAETYPDAPAAVLPVEAEGTKWTFEQIVAYLDGDEGRTGDPSKGAVVFEKASCLKCHRFGGQGERAGPDLTTIAQRFQKREIVESVLFPSQVISDQYAAKTLVLKDGRTLTGLVSPSGDDATTVLPSTGEKVTLKNHEIEETHKSRVSAMPEDLFNTLSLQEIADLFAFLMQRPSEVASLPTEEK
jgi:putative membrane-bound dehydrogenase-like protein